MTVVQPLSDMIGYSVSIIYDCEFVPVKRPLLANTSNIPELLIVHHVHVIGAAAGKVPHVNPAQTPEKIIFVIISPLALVISMVVSIIPVLLNIVGAEILTTGG